MSVRRIAGSVPEKSVGDAINNLPVSVNSVVIFACGLNGHLATPLSSFVMFKLSILKRNLRKINLLIVLLEYYNCVQYHLFETEFKWRNNSLLQK